jgi:hypothetical protein
MTKRPTGQLTVCLGRFSACFLLQTFNKIDVSRHQFALDWMNDFETFAQGASSVSHHIDQLGCELSCNPTPQLHWF